jgi:hypothetical protein
VPAGDYRIEQLADDALALADALGIRTFAFCGLSLGGMVGQWLGAHAADRLTGLVLANTSPRADAHGIEERRQLVLRHGMSGISDIVMGRFFTRHVLAANLPAVAGSRRTLLATDPRGYAGCCAAIRDMDHTASLSGIRVPTLVISGELDVSLPWKGHSELLARGIPDARVVCQRICQHRAPSLVLGRRGRFPAPRRRVTRQRSWTAAPCSATRTPTARSAPTDYPRDFQSDHALHLGDVWGVLPDHLTTPARLAMTAALGRWEEFKLHVRTGLDQRAPRPEGGAFAARHLRRRPAANTAFHLATEEMSARRHLMGRRCAAG